MKQKKQTEQHDQCTKICIFQVENNFNQAPSSPSYSLLFFTLITLMHTHTIQEGLTALMISSRSGRTELTQTLLSGENISLDLQTVSKGSAVNTVSNYIFTIQSTGWSALFFAADKGDRDTVKLLIKAGANPHLTDKVISVSILRFLLNIGVCHLSLLLHPIITDFGLTYSH